MGVGGVEAKVAFDNWGLDAVWTLQLCDQTHMSNDETARWSPYSGRLIHSCPLSANHALHTSCIGSPVPAPAR